MWLLGERWEAYLLDTLAAVKREVEDYEEAKQDCSYGEKKHSMRVNNAVTDLRVVIAVFHVIGDSR